MVKQFNRKIVLENGDEYFGYGFGDTAVEKVCELVFNTSMVGYQEIISDLSYADQAVVLTYPLGGNYGVTDEDFESKTPALGALIVREYNDFPSNFRYTKTLSEYLEENRIPGIYGPDTRKMVRTLRDGGVCKALITSIDTTKERAMALLNAYVLPKDVVQKVSCKKKWYSRTSNPSFNVVAVDFGVKTSFIRALNACGCNVTVLPCDTTAEEIGKMKPDGVFLSNGPGDPTAEPKHIDLTKKLIGKYPIFGMGLGYQLLCLASGAKTKKMKFGNHGANHPVKDTASGKVEIAAFHHLYEVDKDSLQGTDLTLTHTGVLDGTVIGVSCPKQKFFGVQYHSDRLDGPFARFVALMKEEKENA